MSWRPYCPAAASAPRGGGPVPVSPPPPRAWSARLVVDGDRRVESVTPQAPHWLAELGFACSTGARPAAVHRAGARSNGSASTGGRPAPPRVLGLSGQWVELHAAPASRGEHGRDRRVVIVLQAATAPSMAPLISAAYGLTSPRARADGARTAGQGHQRDRRAAVRLAAHRAEPPQVDLRQGGRAQPPRAGDEDLRRFCRPCQLSVPRNLRHWGVGKARAGPSAALESRTAALSLLEATSTHALPPLL